MKKVTFEFRNIQSHEHTRFSLEPGLNFILADDNNVGKSTIFKVMMFALKMPNVSSEDMNELVRGNSNKAYASFEFDDCRVILWFFREDAKKMRSFFEIYRGTEPSIRTVSCPGELVKALDIVTGTDGQPINFNDADSVQLVVQDTPKNDEVLSKVLVDLRIEDIRQKGSMLSKQIIQDYRLIQGRYADTERIINSMHYTDSVDGFRAEEKLLNSAVRVMDTLDAGCSFSEQSFVIPEEEIKSLRVVLNVLNCLSQITFSDSSISVISLEELKRLKRITELLNTMSGVDWTRLSSEPVITEQQITNVRSAVRVLDILTRLYRSSLYASNANTTVNALQREKQEIIMRLKEQCEVVVCPVKGKVFYSDEECVPASDGLTLGLLEG